MDRSITKERKHGMNTNRILADILFMIACINLCGWLPIVFAALYQSEFLIAGIVSMIAIITTGIGMKAADKVGKQT